MWSDRTRSSGDASFTKLKRFVAPVLMFVRYMVNIVCMLAPPLDLESLLAAFAIALTSLPFFSTCKCSTPKGWLKGRCAVLLRAP